MKTCTRFHLEDVEVGDRLYLAKNWDEPENQIIVVTRRFRTSNFGWVLRDQAGEEHYVNDFDVVRLVTPEDDAPPPPPRTRRERLNAVLTGSL
jgi:hypothetical protein